MRAYGLDQIALAPSSFHAIEDGGSSNNSSSNNSQAR
jgi:hypothetical protein